MTKNENEYLAKLKFIAEVDEQRLTNSINETKSKIQELKNWLSRPYAKKDTRYDDTKAELEKQKTILKDQQLRLQKMQAQHDNQIYKLKENAARKQQKLEQEAAKQQLKIAQDTQKQQQKLEQEALRRKEQALQNQLKAELKYQKELLNGNQQTQAAAKKQLTTAQQANSVASRQVNSVYRQTGNEDFYNSSQQLISNYKTEKAYQLEKLNLQNQLNQKLQEERLLKQQQNENYKQQMTLMRDIQSNERKIISLGQEKGSQNVKEINQLKEKTLAQVNELKAIQQTVPLTKQQEQAIARAKSQQERLTIEAQETAKAMKTTQSHAKSLGEYMKNVANYVALYQILNAIQQAMRNAYETILQLDTAFTDIQMVTGYSETQIGDLSQEYNELAKQMGATTQEVAEGATEWLRQGKTIEETTELLKSSMTLSKVGAMESAEATELLTSTLNGYKYSAEEAMGIVDKVSAIDMAAATSSEELMTALSRTANSADDAGISFDKLLAMIGTVSSVTRKSASTIGESFKTIFSRMSNVAAGKDIDDEGETLNDVEETLERMGIALRDSQYEWRNFEDVLDEVAEKWDAFNNTQQSQIATAIAGRIMLPCARTHLKNVA